MEKRKKIISQRIIKTEHGGYIKRGKRLKYYRCSKCFKKIEQKRWQDYFEEENQIVCHECYTEKIRKDSEFIDKISKELNKRRRVKRSKMKRLTKEQEKEIYNLLSKDIIEVSLHFEDDVQLKMPTTTFKKLINK